MMFGDFLKNKREARQISLRELAKQLEVSAPFLSDVENNRRGPLVPDRLERLESVLNLSDQEKALMYDIVGTQRDIVAPDLKPYINTRSYVSAALRTAKDLDAGEEEWAKFVQELQNRRK